LLICVAGIVLVGFVSELYQYVYALSFGVN
jgi:hypothetical protein